ncbi:uncharacterized protein LOC144638790 isoform X2 [Oculina patagonica]
MEVSSLVDNTAYCVQLLAHTVADGPLSACVNVTTLKRVPTDAPKIIEVFNTSSTSLLIRWDHWRAYFNPDVTVGYLIKRTDHNNVTEEIILKDLAQEKTLTRLNKYKEYCVTVTAITRIGPVEGYGDESDEVCAFTAEDAPSAPPANISVTATAVDTIFITWEEVPEQERNGIVRGYKVYVKNADQIIEHESVVDAHVTTLEVSNLVHNTYYCVQLLAYTVADGALSACVNVTTLKKECYDALGMESGSILDAQITASSQWADISAAKNGRLHLKKTDSTAGAWSAATHDANPWLQIDLGGQYFRVTGVATQGRNEDDPQWVTKYKLQYSNDEVNFQYYIEQGQTTDKEFAGNEDRDTVVSHELNPPITARYIRFVPVAWDGWISLRVELYGCQVSSAPPANISVTATAVDTLFITWEEVPEQERNGIIRGYKVYVKNAEQVVEHESVVNASVMTLEVSNLVHDTYYCVQLLAFTVADGALSACVNVTTLKVPTTPPILRSTSTPPPATTLPTLPPPPECKDALGMESRAILDSQITASSEWSENHAANQSRLYTDTAWSAGTTDVNQWLQVDLGSQYFEVTRVATQGSSDDRLPRPEWVTKYKLQYSNDKVFFQYYIEQGQTTDKEFAGNVDSDTVVVHELNPPIRARYIRFVPVTWNTHISMRVELYGCQECQDALGMESGAILDAQITASSEWSENHAAKQGRLNFQQTESTQGSWTARHNSVNQWLQVDLGSQYFTVTRVATQGRNHTSPVVQQWVTRYKLQYSNDKATFQFYIEQGQTTDKEFTGNVDSDTVVSHELNPPIRARYIRFVPVNWKNHISMRVELYGCQVPSAPPANISVSATAVNTIFITWKEVPEQERNGIVREYKVYVKNADLVVEHESTVDANVTSLEVPNLVHNTYYCVQLLAYTVADGALSVCVNVTTLKKAPSAPPANISVTATAVDTIFITWGEVPEQERNGIVQKYKVYVKNAEQVVKHMSVVDAHVTSLAVKNLVHNTYYCVQLLAYTVGDGALSSCVNVTTLKKECQDAVGMESGAILDAKITASTEWSENHAAKQGRLNFQQTGSKAGAWVAGTNDVNQWLQVDLGSQHFRVMGVATQGRNVWSQWVTRYKLQYSNDEVSFRCYIEQGQTTDKEFAGNEDRDTVVSHELNPPIRARYIRFVPVTWYNHISMRVELYGCQECSTEWTRYESFCYKASQRQASWEDARKECLDLHSDLVSITSSAENNFINTTLIPGEGGHWIGLNDKAQEGVFQWSDGTPYNFSSFREEDTSKGDVSNCVVSNDGDWSDKKCSRLRPYVCKKKGFKPLPCEDEAIGIEIGRIVDSKITSNSSESEAYKFEAHKGRLNHEQAWCAQSVLPSYLQVDLNTTYIVCAVATQGYSSNSSSFVEEYKVEISKDGSNWDFYRDITGGKHLIGNFDSYTVRKNIFAERVYARYVRIWPTKWTHMPCMRIELYGHVPFAEIESGNVLFGDSCYSFTESGKTWNENRDTCKGKRGDLVTMETEKEWQFINEEIQKRCIAKPREWHIGLTKIGANWTWVNGRPLTISKWQGGQPSGNGNVTVMSKDIPQNTQGLLNDLSENSIRAFICEMPKVWPPVITDIKVHNIGSHSFEISWDSLPCQSAIELTGYKIIYQRITEQGVLDETKVTITVERNTTNYTVAGLERNSTYCVKILIYNELGDVEHNNCTKVTTSPDCLPGWIFFQTNCYLILEENPLNWYNAEIDCLNRNADLLYILNVEEEAFIDSEMIRSTINEVFIGLIEDENNLKRFPNWSNGHYLDYTNWYENPTEGIPNGIACVAKSASVQGHWNVVNCLQSLPYICKRKGFYRNDAYCWEKALGLETGAMPDINISASSYIESNPPAAARLGSHVAWCPLNLTNPFLQVDLGIPYHVIAVATQGHVDGSHVTRFAIHLSLNGTHWTEFERKFYTAGNYHRAKRNYLNGDVVAQFVRFYPKEWHLSPCMRLEIYGIPAKPFPPPTRAPKIHDAPSVNGTSIQFSFTPPQSYYAAYEITGYNVRFWKNETIPSYQTKAFPPGTVTVVLTGLDACTEYCLSVQAVSSYGTGSYGRCTTAMTDECVPSAVPTNISAFSPDYSTVILSWDPVPEGDVNGELVGYAVLVNGSDGVWFVAPCFSSIELKNINLSSDTCIQMAVINKNGIGPLTNCTKINFAPDTSSPKTAATTAMSLSAIKVTWEHGTKERLSGDLGGFYIKYQAVRIGGEPIVDLLAEPNYTAIVCADVNEILLTNLISYTMYKIQVAVLTTDGIGNFSEPVYGETCRCTEHLSVSVVQSPLESSGFNSLTSIISDLVTTTCGTCEEHNDTKLVSYSSSKGDHVSFPVIKTQAYGDTEYSKFIPVITVPGIVVIQKKSTDSGLLTKVMANSIFEFWPIFVLTLVTALLAGIIIWILDSRTNQEHFPRTFFKGVGEGLWWSVITFSTVGYGDRCPKSMPAKIFAMAWFLIGLVIFAIFMGSLASVLTVTVISMNSNGVSPTGAADSKIAVVANSSEHQMAVKKFRNKIEIGSTFPDLNSMIKALQDGNITSVLLEMYVPVKRKDLFNDSWFEVTDFLEAEITHGVLLEGKSVSKLANEMKNLIVKKNIQTEYLLQENDGMEQSEVDSNSAVFFEPTSPYFLNTIVISAALLFIAVACGLFYQAFCFKQLCGETGDEGTCRCGIMKKDITESVEKFYHNFSKTYHRIREKHKAELAKHAPTDTREPVRREPLTYKP